ncbi:MAG: recombinase family protein, partial [Chloroflexota bacterium]|nr:recombinase family protein [Chloroflexota bacterium]
MPKQVPGAEQLKPTAIKARRVGIYARVSTQNQEDKSSLDEQLRACRELAAGNGWEVSERHVYHEVHTGVELWERPRLGDLRAAIRAKELDVVACYAIDRLSRDPVHLGVLLSEADHAGAEIVFATEAIENTPEGELIRFVRGYAAKIEHAKIKSRTEFGRRARVAGGKPLPGRKAPYGYRWADAGHTQLLPDPETAPIVRRIFRDYAAGGGILTLARALNASGAPGPIGGAWHTSTLRKILRQPVYMGRYVANRYRRARSAKGRPTMVLRPADGHQELAGVVTEPLIEARTWELAQERLATNKQASIRNCRDPEAFLLRGGIARCGTCRRGLGITTKARKTVPPNRYYRCPGGQAGLPGGQPCRDVTIPAAQLDAAAWARVTEILTNPDVVRRELELHRELDPTEADAAGVDRALGEARRRQKKLVGNLALVDDDTAAVLREQLGALAEHIRGLEAERGQVLARKAAWEAAQGELARIEDWCRLVGRNLGRLDYAERRLTLDMLNVQVLVYGRHATPRYVVLTTIPLGSDGSALGTSPG